MPSIRYIECTGEQFFEALDRIPVDTSARVTEPALASPLFWLFVTENGATGPASVAAGESQPA